MYTTISPEGTLNNYAPKTPIYYAEYPTQEQQRRYFLQGGLAVLFINFLVLTALAVS